MVLRVLRALNGCLHEEPHNIAAVEREEGRL